MPDSALLYLAGSIAAFLVGLSKGGLGLLGALGVPILALVISPVRAAAVLLPVYVVSDMIGLWMYRRDFSRENLRLLIPAGTAGIAIGWATASYVSDRGVGLFVGLIGLGFCANTWRLRRRVPAPHRADPVRGIFWGTIMGFTSFVSHSGAPPFQVFVIPQRLPKMTYAGTSTIVFAVINALKLIPYAALGQLSAGNLRIAAVLALPALVGTQIGIGLVRVLPQERYYLVVMMLLLIVSVRLIAKAAGL
jgi:uncharacterized membrane protein YfcA